MNNRSCIGALIVAIIIAAVGIAAVVVTARIAYDEGFYDGRLEGREEAFKINGVTPTPRAVPPRPLDICETPPVTTTEVLVRQGPNLSAPVVAALPQGTRVGVICRSEEMVGSVSWVQVATERVDVPTVTGWIPGQDIDYPPVCMQGRVKPKELLLRESDSVGADVVRAVPEGTGVGVICNSAQSIQGREYWVRVKLVMDGEIVLGWAPADDVL